MKPLKSGLVVGLLAIAMVAIASPAAAHAFPASSDPAPGENLDAAPDQVSITFDEEIDPDGSSLRVVDVDRHVVGTGSVDLTVADRNVLRGDVAISSHGLYTVKWTALSVDGDTTHGLFTFGFHFSGAVPSDAPQEEAPDTALPAPAITPFAFLWLSGLLLIATSTLIGLRRLRSK